MRLSDFDFDLPEALIATRPVRPRRAARLLAADASGHRDLHMTDLPGLLRPGDRLVVNDTRVIPARLSGRRHRPGGAEAAVEVTLLEPAAAPGGGRDGGGGRDWGGDAEGATDRAESGAAGLDLAGGGVPGGGVPGRGMARAWQENGGKVAGACGADRIARASPPHPAAAAAAGQGPVVWSALARPLRKLAPGDRIDFPGGLQARVMARGADRAVLAFDMTPEAFEAALARSGAMPLPPYIARRRPADDRDAEDYQSVFARRSGAVAAPTASLHFDAPLLEALEARGVGFSRLTLHVGAGTFLPVKSDDVSAHRMHGEWGELSARAADEINATRQSGGRIIAVGTTVVRVLESAADAQRRLAPFAGTTRIFITPGWQFRGIDGLITNFHLPRSTLMMLVSALMGRERMLALYAHAISRGYRFFSYGDGSLLLPGPGGWPEARPGEGEHDGSAADR